LVTVFKDQKLKLTKEFLMNWHISLVILIK